MTYAILYAENGDFVADFDSHDEAQHALEEFVAEHHEVRESVGLMAFDDDGLPASDFLPATVALAGESSGFVS